VPGQPVPDGRRSAGDLPAPAAGSARAGPTNWSSPGRETTRTSTSLAGTSTGWSGWSRRDSETADARHQRHLPRLAAEADLDRKQRNFYVRPLRDWKFSVPIEIMVPRGRRIYGQLCADGHWRARSHARRPDRHRRLPRQFRRLRPGHRPVRRLRRPERTRPQKRSPTPSPRAGSPPHPTCEIPVAAARTGELSGHVLPQP
jgi:hypothetical protein